MAWLDVLWLWIPGSRLAAAPGMTAKIDIDRLSL
jgi:hypothetical protein